MICAWSGDGYKRKSTISAPARHNTKSSDAATNTKGGSHLRSDGELQSVHGECDCRCKCAIRISRTREENSSNDVASERNTRPAKSAASAKVIILKWKKNK